MKKGLRILLYCLLGIILLLLGIWVYLYVPEVSPEVLNEKYGVGAEDYLEVEHMKVHYKAEGPAADTVPVVLLHGTNSSLYTWWGWAEQLKKQRRVIRLDLPGFGLTGPHPKNDYRLEMYLDFLQKFLAELGVQRCVLVGNSLGGEIAWRYALQHPQQVQKLVLVGAAGYPIDTEELDLSDIPLNYYLLRIPVVREYTLKLTPPWLIRKSLEFLYGDPEKISPRMVEIYYDMTRREGNREALTERMESFGRPSPWRQISSIEVPTLVLWGGQDRLIPLLYARRFHADLPNSTLKIFPMAGHMPMEEIPEASVQAVEEFLKGSSNGVVPVETLPQLTGATL